jgi:SAM-dependent methyltransferase
MYYSAAVPPEEATRLVKARQILTLIRKHCSGRDISEMVLLDYGASTGLMTAFFAEHFKRVVGVDVDRPALDIAAQRFRSANLSFLAIDNERTTFEEGSFDVVVANQVYNYVENQGEMFTEIHRVLKPGGICFLGARNKYAVIEPLYGLPLLSMLPADLAKLYLRVFRKTSTFVGHRYLSHAGLMKLAAPFKVHDYTLEILRRPADFGFDSLTVVAPLARMLPLEWIVGLIPNYIMILERRA